MSPTNVFFSTVQSLRSPVVKESSLSRCTSFVRLKQFVSVQPDVIIPVIAHFATQ